jgi:hypothetical protein
MIINQIEWNGIRITIRILIRVLTDAINVIYIDIDTVENIWLRKM